MTSILTRRSLLRGLFAMPAVVATSSLMPVRGIIVPVIDDFETIFQRNMARAYALTRKQIEENLFDNAWHITPPEAFGVNPDSIPKQWARLFA